MHFSLQSKGRGLKDSYQPDAITWDTDWQDESLKTIQIKTPFTVTVTKQIPIVIFRPALTAPIVFNITIRASVSGISEVYWK